MKYSIVELTKIINNCNSVDDLKQVEQLFVDDITNYNQLEGKVVHSRINLRILNLKK